MCASQDCQRWTQPSLIVFCDCELTAPSIEISQNHMSEEVYYSLPIKLTRDVKQQRNKWTNILQSAFLLSLFIVTIEKKTNVDNFYVSKKKKKKRRRKDLFLSLLSFHQAFFADIMYVVMNLSKNCDSAFTELNCEFTRFVKQMSSGEFQNISSGVEKWQWWMESCILLLSSPFIFKYVKMSG